MPRTFDAFLQPCILLPAPALQVYVDALRKLFDDNKAGCRDLKRELKMDPTARSDTFQALQIFTVVLVRSVGTGMRQMLDIPTRSWRFCSDFTDFVEAGLMQNNPRTLYYTLLIYIYIYVYMYNIYIYTYICMIYIYISIYMHINLLDLKCSEWEWEGNLHDSWKNFHLFDQCRAIWLCQQCVNCSPYDAFGACECSEPFECSVQKQVFRPLHWGLRTCKTTTHTYI